MKRRGVRGTAASGRDNPGPALENTGTATTAGEVGVARAGGPVRAAVAIMMAVVGGAAGVGRG